MRLKYLGDQPVDIPEIGQIVEPGQIIDVTDDIGARMAESAIWQATKAKATSSSEEVV